MASIKNNKIVGPSILIHSSSDNPSLLRSHFILAFVSMELAIGVVSSVAGEVHEPANHSGVCNPGEGGAASASVVFRAGKEDSVLVGSVFTDFSGTHSDSAVTSGYCHWASRVINLRAICEIDFNAVSSRVLMFQCWLIRL